MSNDNDYIGRKNRFSDMSRDELIIECQKLSCGVAQARRGSMAAQWTYDPEAEAYYFAPMQAAPPPYLKQRHVDAIIDIAADGTLAGVELIDNMPPPPSPVSSTNRAGGE